MLPQQRHRAILELLAQEGALRTNDIADRFAVTVETIRRDLEMLHSEGLLARTHGGAIASDHPTREQSSRERQILRLAEKRALARAAVGFLQPRDIVFLDASSTVLQLAHVLPDLELTVVTHSLDVLEALEGRRDIKLISTGGRYVSASRSFVGRVALETTRRYQLQKLFFSGNGIDLERGLSETSEDQAHLKADLIPLSERRFFLSDASKTGHRAAYFFSPAEQIDCWLTTAPDNLEDLDPFRRVIERIKVVPVAPAVTAAKE